MKRYRGKTQQSQQEEAQKSLKHSKASEVVGGSKVNPAVQRAAAEGGDAQAILDLQRTVGNRAVGRLLAGSPATIQRDAIYEAEDLAGGGSSMSGMNAAKTPSMPETSTPGPAPLPGAATTASQDDGATFTKQGKQGANSGSEPGTMLGLGTQTTMGNAPSPSAIRPSQSPVTITDGSSTQEEGATPPAAPSTTQQPEEDTGS